MCTASCQVDVDLSNILEHTSTMIEETPLPASDINQRIAARVSQLRAGRGMSLDALSKKSDVSRSMISLIERGEASPTAVVLDKLALGLGVTLASLFEAPGAAPDPLARRADQLAWTDPQSGYTRRNISPPHCRSSLQIVEVDFPAGATVNYQPGMRAAGIDQQVWVLDGRIDIEVDGIAYSLQAGDCLAMAENCHIVYRNNSKSPARYAVVVNAASLTD